MNRRAWLEVLAAPLLCAVLVLAQDLDLPMQPPKPFAGIASGKHADPLPLSSPVEEKDPRDEPPPVFFGEEIGADGGAIVFVIDRSGSMSDPVRPYATGIGPGGQVVPLDPSIPAPPTRMEAAKAELRRCIAALAPSFRFNLFAYDCTITQWSAALQPADPAPKASALAWLEGLQPGGATATGPATAAALLQHPNCVSFVLLTDGAPNCPFGDRSEHRAMIRAANRQGATIAVFGIAAYGEFRGFCQAVAADSGGPYYDVSVP
ncbi:MAG TPA: hypothetical protein VEA38_01645 [Terriglobales bacterium]|nr:hypothetical protein [Terriglobales bacterium]